MTTPFSPSNSDGEVKIIVRASEKAEYRAENDVTNFRFPCSRSWQSDKPAATIGFEQETSCWKAGAWKNAASRAAEIEKGDIIILEFHMADIEPEGFKRADETIGASLKIKRIRARVIHAKGGTSTYEAETTREE